MEEIIFNARSPNREHYTVIHRPLQLGQADDFSDQDGGIE